MNRPITLPAAVSPLSRASYSKIVEFDIAYLEALPVTPGRARQIAALRLGAELYSPPFSSAYERLAGTDVADAQRETSTASESIPTIDGSHVSTTNTHRTNVAGSDGW